MWNTMYYYYINLKFWIRYEFIAIINPVEFLHDIKAGYCMNSYLTKTWDQKKCRGQLLLNPRLKEKCLARGNYWGDQ